MKKQIILGQLRELLMIIGSLCFATFEGTTSVVGLIVALASLTFAIVSHEGKEIVFTSIRKALTFVPACLVAFDVIPADKSALVGSGLLAVLAIIWSFKSNSGKPLPVPPKELLALALCLTIFPSCTLAIPQDEPVRLPHGVLLSQSEDGKASAKIDHKTIVSWISSLSRIASGEDPKEVILAPLSNTYGSK